MSFREAGIQLSVYTTGKHLLYRSTAFLIAVILPQPQPRLLSSVSEVFVSFITEKGLARDN